MKRLAFIALGAALLMTVGAAFSPAQALCVSARLFTSGNSYVYTPGYESGGGFMNSSVSPDFRGAFWGIGSGNLASDTAGIDNGTFPALFVSPGAVTVEGWIGIDPGYPAYIFGNWASSTAINNCIEDAAEPKCMAILLMDNDANSGSGAFALLTDLPDNLLNFNFEQPNAGPINLVTVPGLSIQGSVRTSSCSGLPAGRVCDSALDCEAGETCVDGTGVDVTVGGLSLSSIEAGLYLDPGCPAPTGAPGEPAAIEGYLVFARELPRGSSPPDDNATEGWGDPVSAVIPLGAPGTVSLSCTGDTDQYLTAALVFDSGSVSRYVTGPTTRFECGANLADPEEEIQRKPRNRERPRSRSRGR